MRYEHLDLNSGNIEFAGGPSFCTPQAVILGGPVLYLLGNALFKHSLIGRVPPSRLVGLLALALLIPLAVAADRLVLSAATTLVLATLAAATVGERTSRSVAQARPHRTR